MSRKISITLSHRARLFRSVSLIAICFCVATILILLTTAAHADIFVTSSGNAKVLQYDEVTGEFLGVFVQPQKANAVATTNEPTGIVFGADGNLYLDSFSGNYVKRYDGQTGAYLDTFVTARSGGLLYSWLFAFGPDGHLYIPSGQTDQIKVYSGTTGQYIKSIDDSMTGCAPHATAFNKTGELFVSCSGGSIMQFDPATGQNLSVINLPGVAPNGLAFGTDGEIYVGSRASDDAIVRVDASGVWGPFGFLPTDGIIESVHFGPDGMLYATQRNPPALVRFDPESGEYLGEFVAARSGGLHTPRDFTFTPRIPGPPVQGDFNGNRLLDATDIDRLTARVRAGGDINRYDLNADRQLNQADRRVWIGDLKKTYFGDSNLDGQFDSQDFVTVFQAGQYEDAVSNNSSWASGDWDGDSEFTSSDLVFAFQNGDYDKGPRAGVGAVPEPQNVIWIFVWALSLVIRRAQRSVNL